MSDGSKTNETEALSQAQRLEPGATKPSAVITGASTGIGLATCKVLLGAGWRVFGSVRKESDAARLQAELGGDFEALVFDVTDASSIERAASAVALRLSGAKLQGLVNNAGIAIFGALAFVPLDQFRQQLEVNLTGVLAVTQAFLPQLGMDRSLSGRPGRIVQISSMGGKLAAPFLGPYVASKHGLEGLSESLRRELLLFGIDVIVIGPGAVKTPIWDKAESMEDAAGLGTEFERPMRRLEKGMKRDGRKGLEPEVIGKNVLEALTRTNPKVRYAPVPDKFRNWTLPRLLPKRMVDRFLGKALGLIEKS